MYSHYGHSKVFKIWCIALVVVVFIIGIVAGFIFKVQATSRIYYEEHFNWGLAVIIWLSDVIPAAILYAIYSHLENQEIQINNLNQIRQTLNDFKLAAKETATVTTTAHTKSNFKKYDNLDTTWVCSNCGKSNPVGAERCSYCDYKNI